MLYLKKNSPLYFAVIHNKIDIVKFLLDDKRFLNKQVVKKINLFEYAICHGFTEISELLLNHPNTYFLLFKILKMKWLMRLYVAAHIIQI